MAKSLDKGYVGAVVRARRSELGITQAELAKRAGLSRGTVINAEKDAHVPRYDVVLNLARGLGLAPSAFLPPDQPRLLPPASWETVARRLRLTYDEAVRLRALLAEKGVLDSASTEQAVLVWMHEREVLP